eukprot:4286315-Ditylum_brightwellii.AAC.1
MAQKTVQYGTPTEDNYVMAHLSPLQLLIASSNPNQHTILPSSQQRMSYKLIPYPYSPHILCAFREAIRT